MVLENVIPRIKKNIFVRKEDNNVTVLHHVALGADFLNSTSSEIFDLIDGKNNCKEIFTRWVMNYPTLNEEDLVKDFENTMWTLKNLGFILWKGEIKMKYEKNNVVGEDLFEKTSKFYLRFLGKPNEYSENSYLGTTQKAYFIVPNIRTRSFYAQENYFVSIENGNITSAISLQGLNLTETTQTITSFLALESKEDDLIKLMSYVAKLLKSMGCFKMKIIVKEDERDILEPKIARLGFKYETTLKNEFKNKDCIYYGLML